jgi:hypothetical protein
MAKQKENGMAFEWAIGKAISSVTNFRIIDDKFSQIPRICYEEKIPDRKRSIFDKAALVAARHILNKEDISVWNKDKSSIKFNSDAAGQIGDVRDLIIQGEDRQLGISCKANHQALKHSRLSGKLNFIKKWGLSSAGCSAIYWDEVKPIFKELADIRRLSNRTATWEGITNKAERFYWPILDAWASEVQRAVSSSEDNQVTVCKNFLSII